MKEIFSRINQYLLFAILIVVVLFFGRTLLIPVVFAAMLAMLMAPVCRRFEKWGFNRPLATIACILILIFVIAGIGAIITAQIAAFSEDVNQIETKAKELTQQMHSYVQEKFGITEEQQKETIKEQTKEAGKNVGGLITKVLNALTSAIGGIALTLVFTFLLIFNKEKYETFFLKLYKDQDTNKTKEIVTKISEVSQRYLTGRAMSVTIIAVLYAIGLSIVGIKNAILLACIAALLTVIPYVGTVLGGLFPVVMALVTEDSAQPALLAIVVMFSIQTIDNYFIEPNIVGGEVSLNALTSIISILAGGLVWGVAGMILFLPMFGIIKIICDNVESLKPFGYIIGDSEGNKGSKIKEWLQKKFTNKRSDGSKKN